VGGGSSSDDGGRCSVEPSGSEITSVTCSDHRPFPSSTLRPLLLACGKREDCSRFSNFRACNFPSLLPKLRCNFMHAREILRA
jgi:hypothetical protein